jgi:sugar phosphate isomerase/epimerase
MKGRLELALPHLFMVTINGADPQGKDWDRLIQPLDRGTFDMYGFLKTLKELGYTGPIGLQGYGVKGDPYENLKRSMEAWRALSERIAAGG